MSDLDSPESQEIEPSNSYFKLVLQFEKHNSDEWKGTLKEEDFAKYQALVDQEAALMRQAFVKSQKNVLLREAALPNFETRKLFIQKYNETHSARHAEAFATFVFRFHREPTATELENTGNYIFDNVTGTAFYSWAGFEAVDTLNQEGYEIDFVWEKYTETPTINSIHLTEIVDNLATKVTDRNDTVKDQIVNISEEAKNNKQQTNMFVILGLLHNELVEELPDSIIENTSAVTEFDQKRPHPEIISEIDRAIKSRRQRIRSS